MLNYASLINLWQTMANYGKAMAKSGKFWQCLPDSTEVY